MNSGDLDHLRPRAGPDTVTRESLRALSAAYTPVADQQPRRGKGPAPPLPLADLDSFRFVELPDLIRARKGRVPPGRGSEVATAGWVEKQELQKLMLWKLYRGTYRPTLPKLIASNSPEDVVSATFVGFALLAEPAETAAHHAAFSPFPPAVLKELTKLKGVGPATASLLAAVAQPGAVPFFSDELYAWLDERGARPAKYNDKEYSQIRSGVAKLTRRLLQTGGKENGELKGGVEAVDVERAAYVAVRSGLLEEGGEREEESGKEDENDVVPQDGKSQAKEPAKTQKRKRENNAPSDADDRATRRSTRKG